MASRVHTLAEVAEIFDCTAQTLARKRQGDRLVLGKDLTLRCIKIGRKVWVAEAELARFLGESTSERPAAGHHSGEPAVGAGRSAHSNKNAAEGLDHG